MAELSINDLTSDLYKYNPIAMTHYMIRILPDFLAGKTQLLEATSPVALLVEMAATLATASMTNSFNTARRLYPSLAVEDDDIYRHMADKDYIDIFSKPAIATFTLLLPKDEVITKSVVDNSGIKHFVIPRNTRVSVNGIDFTFLYPVDIRTMLHGGLQVAYNINSKSPLQNIERDIIDYRLISISNQVFIQIPVELQQLTVETYRSDIRESTRLSESYQYTDKYYFTRVYFLNTDNTWKEINTTHSEQVFNVDTPTALLRVTDGIVKVTIPAIYLKTNLISHQMRVDIYTTKGNIDIDLGIFPPQTYSMKWYDLDGDTTLAQYSAGLNSLSEAAIYSHDKIDGGRNGLSFSDIKDRVISNGSKVSLPITQHHIETMLSDRNYKIIKLIDNITSRMYLATRAITPPKSGDTVTGAGIQTTPLLATIDELISHPKITVAGQRITLRPTVLYQENDLGKLVIVPYQETLGLLELPIDVRSSRVNANKYYYTPWHYVVDTSQNRMEVRAYHLTNPGVVSRTALKSNDKISVTISVGTIDIDCHDDHFSLVIETSSGAQFKGFLDEDIIVQLSFVAEGENSRGYMLGELISTDPDTFERSYQFDLTTHFDISDSGLISFNSFKQLDSDTLRILYSKLLCNFEVTFIVLNQNTPEAKDVALQTSIAEFMIPTDTTDYLALVKEGFDIQFGSALESLWIHARSMVRPDDYATYTANVPKVYAKDVYQLTSNGYIDLQVNQTSGLVEGIITHHAGDPMLDVNGDPIFEHQIGDIILNNGAPQIASPRTIEQLITLMLIDGRYYFANDLSTTTYKTDYEGKLVEWINGDIAWFGTQLLDQTLIRFYPQKTTGVIKVFNEQGNVISIPSEQKLTLQLTVPNRIVTNADLRKIISDKAVKTIDTEFSRSTISLSNIISSLSAVLGSDVYGINLTGLTLTTFTIDDGGSRPTIGKKLSITPEGTLAVRDDIVIEYIHHLG